MSMSGSGGYSGRPSEVRLFLRAGSPQGLVRLQLQVNTLLKGQANYTDFSFVKGQWYCWFLVNIEEHPEVVEFINGLA